jgi:hypothetical protein
MRLYLETLVAIGTLKEVLGLLGDLSFRASNIGTAALHLLIRLQRTLFLYMHLYRIPPSNENNRNIRNAAHSRN